MNQITKYWEQFVNSLDDSSKPLEMAGFFHFGGEEDATSIAVLVTSGVKKSYRIIVVGI